MPHQVRPFFSNVVDETKSNIPSIGGLRRVTNKVRIEENKIKPGFNLHVDNRATVSAYDTAPNDSNKVGVFFSPISVLDSFPKTFLSTNKSEFFKL